MSISPITLIRGLSISANALAATDAPFHDYVDLLGQWNYHGVFPVSGKSIDSELRFEPGLDGKALLKHHDDTSAPRSTTL